MLSSAQEGFGNSTHVGGDLVSTPRTRRKKWNFIIQFISNPSTDRNEGKTFLGQMKVKSDREGNALDFGFSTSAVSEGEFRTATNRATGDTSKFSQAKVRYIAISKFIPSSSLSYRLTAVCSSVVASAEERTRRRAQMLIELAATTALPILTKVLSEYLRIQAGPSVTQLQRKEGASEVLVGFLPDISGEEAELLSFSSGAPIQERTTALRSAQDRVNEVAVDTVRRIEPTRGEVDLPGIGKVEQDLSQVQDQEIDVSWLTNVVRLTATPSMIGKLTRRKHVAFVVPNFKTTLPQPVKVTEEDVKPVHQQEENEKEFTWGIDYLKVPELWGQGLTGENVLIGHLDTGVDVSHPDLEGKVEKFALFDPRGQMVESRPFDSGDHGTHTAGTMVGGDVSGVSIGVAPKAKLASALVLMNGSGTVWQIIKGMEWAVSQRARILNLSLGGAGYSSMYEYAVSRVASVGVFPACSVGNDGLAITGSPGNIGLSCGVGAIDHTGSVADFSGGGSVSWYNELGQLVEIHKPDIVAPGVAIRSSIPQGRWDYLNGTSMAAPHVSGIVALLIQAKPSAPLTELIQIIYSTAKHPTTFLARPRDSRFGLGIIDPIQALEQLGA